MRLHRDEGGWSAGEITVVLAVLAILLGMSAYMLTGANEDSKDRMPIATLNSAWDTTQAFYNGRRGPGQQFNAAEDEVEGSYGGVSIEKLHALDPTIKWDYPPFPGQEWPNHERSVVVEGVASSIMILCVAVPRKTTVYLCRGEDGRFVPSPKYGAGSSADQAIESLCHDTPRTAVQQRGVGCGVAINRGDPVG